MCFEKITLKFWVMALLGGGEAVSLWRQRNWRNGGRHLGFYSKLEFIEIVWKLKIFHVCLKCRIWSTLTLCCFCLLTALDVINNDLLSCYLWRVCRYLAIVSHQTLLKFANSSWNARREQKKSSGRKIVNNAITGWQRCSDNVGQICPKGMVMPKGYGFWAVLVWKWI